jgi:hypothetical protein
MLRRPGNTQLVPGVDLPTAQTDTACTSRRHTCSPLTSLAEVLMSRRRQCQKIDKVAASKLADGNTCFVRCVSSGPLWSRPAIHLAAIGAQTGSLAAAGCH